MKIISIEGIDASGKETQAKILSERLRKAGYHTVVYSFPRYNNHIGKLIGQWLRGEIELNEKAVHLLYEADRQDFMDEIPVLQEAGIDVVICDRYTLSNLAFGTAKGIDTKWLSILQRYVLKADLTFFLDIPPEESVARRTTGRDRHEIDIPLLNRVVDAYKQVGYEIGNTESLYYPMNGLDTEENIADKMLQISQNFLR